MAAPAAKSMRPSQVFGARRPAPLFVSQDGFLISRRLQLANMVARHAVPMTSSSRDIAEVGGLMSYGTNITEVFRQMGVYTGRIHKGAKRRQDARPRRAVDAARARR